METSNLQLTPEQRQALLTHPEEPLYITDEQTQKVYVLVEKGKSPELEEAYIRDGLEIAREEIARGETSDAAVEQLIGEARRRHELPS
jgi:hypothetical protein